MFKRKAGNGITNDLIGCLGKLPLHNEFIKHRLLTPELANLDRWYQSVYHHFNREYGRQFEIIFSQLPLYHFMYLSPQHKPLLGVLIASQDLSKRSYPFVTFRVLEGNLENKLPALLPLAYENFYNATDLICVNITANQTLPDLFNQIDALKLINGSSSHPVMSEQAIQLLQKTKFTEFWRLIVSNHPEVPLAKFIETVLSHLNAIKNDKTNAAAIGIRLPLGDGSAHTASIIFWLQLLQAVLKQQRLQIFWHRSNSWHKASLIIYFKPIPVSDFQHLLNPAIESPNFIDIIKISKNAAWTEPVFREAQQNINLTGSLLETLNHWTILSEQL